jgi:6-methylsalicylate decarboxylase
MARTIDVHQHFLPDFFWRETNEGTSPVGGIAPPPWTESTALSFMDDAGIDVAMLSISTPGVHVGDDKRARTLARRCNEFAAQLIQSRPDRFGSFAALPLPDIDGALEELSYALDVLTLDGVLLFSNVQVMCGSDYPYFRRDLAVGCIAALRRTEELADSEREAVLGANALRLFPRVHG